MTLSEIAAEMKHEAARQLNTPIRRQLSGGLRLVVLDTIRGHQVSLIRDGTQPSVKEIEVIRRDFGVPDGATLERDRKLFQNQVSYIARLIWPRTGQRMTMLADHGDRVIVQIQKKPHIEREPYE